MLRLLLFNLLFFGSYLYGQEDMQSGKANLTVPRIINYTTQDYNGHAQNFAIVQDSRGIMFIGNGNGMLEYDGTIWNRYVPEKNSLVVSLAIDKNNTIFFGGLNEFGMAVPGENSGMKLKSLSNNIADSLGNFNYVWQTIVIDESVFFNCGNHVFEYRKGKLDHYKAPDEYTRLFEVRGELWLSSPEEGLFRLNDNEFKPLTKGSYFADHNIISIQPFIDDKYLVISRNGPIYIYADYEDHHIVPFAEKFHSILEGSIPYGAILLHNDNIAINTIQNGVFIFDKEQNLVRHITRKHGLQNESVIGIYEDANNLLWCALDNGISVIDLSGQLSYAYEGDQFYGTIQDIEKLDQQMYVATIQGLYRANLTDSVPELKRLEGVPGLCFDLYPTKDEMLVSSAEIYSVSGNKAEKIAPYRTRVIKKLKQVHDHIIAGGVDGIFVLRKKEGKWQTVYKNSEFPDEIYDIRQIGISSGFWVRTISQGLFKAEFSNDYSEMEVTQMDDEALAEGQISLIDYGGNILFSVDHELYEYDHEQDKFVESEFLDGLQEYFIYKLRSSEDHTWISTGKGIIHLNNGKIDSTSFFGVNIGGINAVFPDKHGNCWIGGDDALIHYDNSKEPVANTFITNIRKVTIGDSTLFFSVFQDNGAISFEQQSIPELSYENNSITFHFSSAWYLDDNIQYSFMLEGYDGRFSSWSIDNKAVYTSLPEGDYVFKVKARNTYNKESTVATFRFSILPPWYRTWWAYTMFILAGLGIIWAIVRFYVRRLKNEKQRLEEIVSQRTVELDDKNRKLEQTNEEITYQKALLEEKNKDITDSILYAQKIQSALLVSNEYLAKHFRDYFLIYKPKDILSGDFYWAYRHKTDTEDKMIWAAADCTGHGVPGSLMSMLGNSFLNEIVVENKIHDPGKILDSLREYIVKSLSHGEQSTARDGMDIALCVHDIKAKKLHFSGAKNPLWLIRKTGGTPDGYDRKHEGASHVLYEWKGDHQPVGYAEVTKPFTVKSISIEEGDYIMTFSDGFSDQFGGEENKKLQLKRFREIALDFYMKGMNMEKELSNYFEKWKGDLDQLDDVCVIGVRV